MLQKDATTNTKNKLCKKTVKCGKKSVNVCKKINEKKALRRKNMANAD